MGGIGRNRVGEEIDTDLTKYKQKAWTHNVAGLSREGYYFPSVRDGIFLPLKYKICSGGTIRVQLTLQESEVPLSIILQRGLS